MISERLIKFVNRKSLFFLLFFSWFLFCFRIWTNHIFFTDELIIEDASYAMAHGSSWLVPTLNGLPLLTKPPLLYWQTAPLYYFFPAWHWLVRVWMPIYGVGLVFITYKLAGLWFGKRVGFLSALLLSSCTLIVFMTKSANYDLPNAFFTVLAIYFYNLAKNNKWFLLLAAVVFGLGLLDRSYLALTPLLVIIVDFSILPKKISVINLLGFILGGFSMLIMWGYFSYQIVPSEFIRDNFTFPLQLHLFGFNPGDVQDPLYYFSIFVWFLPSFFLLFYRYLYVFKPKIDSTIQIWTWIIGWGIIFLIAHDPHIWYFFPLFPALAIASGRIVSEILKKKGRSSFAYFCLIIMILVVPISLVIADIPQADTITAVSYMKQNSPLTQPLYFWKYPIVPLTHFYPGRQIVILDETTLKTAYAKDHMKYLLIRTIDLGDISHIPPQTIYFRGSQFTLLQFYN